MKKPKNQKAYLLLHNIRSAENVGAIFRTGEAAGVTTIFLSGYTPAPIDRFNRPRSDIAKAALGAQNLIPWQHFKTIDAAFGKIRKEKVSIIALEQSGRAVDYKKIKLKKSFCLILGNEVKGLSTAILKKSDLVIEIPMRGKKESLNVSVALGIALFRILNI